jgi:cytochrome c oxidase cbb3-type subunit III
MTHQRDVDDVTGTETTGHVWDGDLKELNKPLPRWWLYTFYACIVWAAGYQIAYPAWPMINGYTKGMLGYSQRATVDSAILESKMEQSKYLTAIGRVPLGEISKQPDLLNFSRAGGGALFASHCSGCHGRGAQGFAGYPNLNDDDWLWGGSIDDILTTITNGIRSGHKLTRDSAMPKFGADKILKPEEISDAAEYVLSLSKHETVSGAASRGQKTFADQCAACHGENGKGTQSLGAPNLTDSIWLYGGDKTSIMESISTGRGGVMPSWESRFDASTLKMLAVYVHSLGGGTEARKQ